MLSSVHVKGVNRQLISYKRRTSPVTGSREHQPECQRQWQREHALKKNLCVLKTIYIDTTTLMIDRELRCDDDDAKSFALDLWRHLGDVCYQIQILHIELAQMKRNNDSDDHNDPHD